MSADLCLGVIYCWSCPIHVTAGCMSQYDAINSAIKEGNCMGGVRVAVIDRSAVFQVWWLTQIWLYCNVWYEGNLHINQWSDTGPSWPSCYSFANLLMRHFTTIHNSVSSLMISLISRHGVSTGQKVGDFWTNQVFWKKSIQNFSLNMKFLSEQITHRHYWIGKNKL